MRSFTAKTLLKAVRERDIALALEALNAGVDINSEVSADEVGLSGVAPILPLWFAILGGEAEFVRLFIERGARVRTVYPYGATPLMAAIVQRQLKPRGVDVGDAIVCLLLDAGADVDAATPGGGTAWTQAEAYADAELLRLLARFREDTKRVQST